MTQIIGTFVDFEGMRAAFALRKNDLRLTNLEIDDIAGLQGGYTGKILCGMKRPGDMSLPALLGALGCELALVRSRAEHQKSRAITTPSVQNLKKVLGVRGKKGAAIRNARLPDRKRRELARKAAKARWSRSRCAKTQPSVNEIASETMSALL
jgi:hypothetical protein